MTKIIIARKPRFLGIYHLVMKEKEVLDNFRVSAIQGIINRIKTRVIEVIVYEPVFWKRRLFLVLV